MSEQRQATAGLHLRPRRTRSAQLIAEEGNPDLMLRIYVQGGGCSGFQYGFTFDENAQDGDSRVVRDGVTLLIDPMSLQYLVRGRGRLHRGSAGCAVRDPQPQRHHDLRLRVLVLGLMSGALRAPGPPGAMQRNPIRFS